MQVVVAAAVGTTVHVDELDHFKINPASFGLAGRNENKLCGADIGAEQCYFIINPASSGLAGREENELCGADFGAENFLHARARTRTRDRMHTSTSTRDRTRMSTTHCTKALARHTYTARMPV